MSAVEIIAIISICAMVIGSFLANMFSLLMSTELYERNQDRNFDRFTRAGWPSPMRRLPFQDFREYRDSFPNGKLHIYSLAGFALAMIGLIGLAICIGIFNQWWSR
jgi:hypothetical protein